MSKMQNPTRTQLHQDILDLLRKSGTILQEFKPQIENKTVIIFVGNTRSGKSTLVNFLSGVPLVAVKRDRSFKVECLNESPAPIGHGSLSSTTVPTTLSLVKYPNILVIDAPGFEDNRGPLQEIFNALYINQVKYAKFVKFVLVVDIIDILTDSVNSFLRFIEIVSRIIPDTEKLQKAASIVFTKVTDEHDHLTIAKLLELKVLSHAFYCRADLVEQFVRRPELIGIFREPRQDGLITYEIGENVEGCIFNQNSVSLKESEVKFGISTEARVVLLEAYTDFSDVQTFMGNIIANFSEAILLQLEQIRDDKLSLDDHQLNCIANHLKGYGKNEFKTKSVTCIPDSLYKLFVTDTHSLFARLNDIITVKLETDFCKIDEIRTHLDYLTCIEKVVEKDNQSRNIIHVHMEWLELFRAKIDLLRDDVQREINFRKKLKECVKITERMNDRLSQLTDRYLEASANSELKTMKKEANKFDNYLQIIKDQIAIRPNLFFETPMILDNTSININAKIKDIGHYIDIQKNRWCLTQAISYFSLFLAGVTPFVNIRYVGLAFAGLVLFCCSMKNGRRIMSHYQSRWMQTRFCHSTVLDGCCKDLEYILHS